MNNQGIGGDSNWGTVFKLTPSSKSWIGTLLHRFTGGADGGVPYGTLIFDSAGNLYGTTLLGGSAFGTAGYGVVFELTP